MKTFVDYLKNGIAAIATASVVANAFAAGEPPLPPSTVHPLLTPVPSNHYRPELSKAIARAAGDDGAHLRAGGFMVELEKVLAEPAAGVRIVDYPKPVSAEMLRITAVVPLKGYENLPIPVCAEQNNKVLGIWNITAKGDVVPMPWAGSTVSETPTSAACKAFILAARADINKFAQSQPPATAPSAYAPEGKPGVVVSAYAPPEKQPDAKLCYYTGQAAKMFC